MKKVIEMKNLQVIFIILFLIGCNGQSTNDSSKSEVIGKPIQYLYLEIAQYDFPDKMTWIDAKIACSSLGNGWRLPKMNELKTFRDNKSTDWGLNDSSYWSSDEDGSSFAWSVNTKNGDRHWINKASLRAVRAVRDL